MEPTPQSTNGQPPLRLDYETGEFTHPGRRIWSVGRWLLVGGVLLFLVLYSMTPNLSRATESGNRKRCASNLREIHQAIMQHSSGRRQPFADFGELLIAANGNLHPECLVCPSSNDERALGDSPAQWASAIRTTKNRCSYVMVANVRPQSAAADAVLAYEPVSFHAGKSAHVLYASGKVEFASPQKVRFIEQELAAGVNPPRWSRLR